MKLNLYFGLLILDRDGVINENSNDPNSPFYYIRTPEHFIFKEGVLDALSLLKGFSGDVCICTRQRCISKGIVSRGAIFNLHDYMNLMSWYHGGRETDRIYIEPESKSKVRILKQALRDYNCPPSKALLLDDNKQNIEDAAKIGISGIQITEDNSLLEVIYGLL